MIYGRRPRQLLVVWGFSLLLIGLLYWLEMNAPALHDLLLPFYWIVFFVALFFTWRWLRARSRKERRGGDRRHADRRGRDASDTYSGDSGKGMGERL
jgi:membrane protein implicated in regulation of membrane protease activity